jgi:FlaA1/EpsC-like NDP-sugar epimerase
MDRFNYKLKLKNLLWDMFFILPSWYFSFLLRFEFNFQVVNVYFKEHLNLFLFLMIFQVFSLYFFKVYRGIRKHFSRKDIARIISSVLISCFVSSIFVNYCGNFNFPRSTIIIYSIIFTYLTIFTRIVIKNKKYFFKSDARQKNALIICLSDDAEICARKLIDSQDYNIIGYLDNNLKRIGLEIYGIKVLGEISQLEKVTVKYKIDTVFLSSSNPGALNLKVIINECDRLNLSVYSAYEFNKLPREFKLENLLNRKEIDEIFKNNYFLKGCRVVVTGGGGSIGSELCRQILRQEPEALMIVDNCEYNLYKIHHELRNKYPSQKIHLSLASVTDERSIDNVFSRFRPSVVFHAAAFKHVPLLEEQAYFAVKNNFIGTKIVAQTSVLYKVDKFILISSDKAVNPTNVMGATKRLAEIYCQRLNAIANTRFIIVRFGNVLGSTGSVLPLFQEQLKKGGPLTVTHPDMERYFMSISEAAHLILEAVTSNKGGEIYVLDMGAPIKIKNLAESLISMDGKEPYKDVEIHFTGLREGEKLFEELFYANENLDKTFHERIFKASNFKIDWNKFDDICAKFDLILSNEDNSKIFEYLHKIIIELNNNLVSEVEES